ncbi:BQ5605_C075g12925 [Microbotryum silenes-dioicae]|uniref:BQ5605_C031g10931 protein n=1 Tax=Microbotryum silenes-dioicae TaxID=796604 RepID=A0A2X0PPQ1_9BASI|nr:BQ5605_C031g10931 [Microbotryum silenes-dioicae]SGZ34831.1 BQ5605_C075g12925 [Microbotryum silenes-dioicae]
MLRIQSQRHGFKLHTASRGALDNPGTGLNGLFVNQCCTTKIGQLTFDKTKALLANLFMLQPQSHDAQVRYGWKKYDLAAWDNRSTNHGAGDQAVYGHHH